MKSWNHARGQRNGVNTILTIEDAREIRKLRTAGGQCFPRSDPRSLHALTRRFGVSKTTVSQIVNGHIWHEKPDDNDNTRQN